MNLKKWFYLFFSTLLVGALSSLVTGLIMDTELWAMGAGNLVAAALWYILLGFLFSVISQMGFFAYLTINRFGLGLFKGPSLWQIVQLTLIAFAFFDMVYFRYIIFGQEGENPLSYTIMPLLLFLASLGVAYVKSKQTNSTAFVPALFFMFVVTMIEWLPALKVNSEKWIITMIIPLFLCNTWQILQLHRLTKKSPEQGIITDKHE
jgi:KinB signaling pathway activation protein